MRGKVLGYDKSTEVGVISGEDGKRYNFTKIDWKSPNEPTVNANADFETQDNNAVDIYKVGSALVPASGSAGQKKWIAVVLALPIPFPIPFGLFGAHKFYLGYKKQGIIMALSTLIGLFLLGIPTFVIFIISLIEFIAYITKSDEQFEETYINNKKPWF